MFRKFAEELERANGALDAFHEGLQRSAEHLWKETELAGRGDAFVSQVRSAFEEVFPPTENRTVSVPCEVEQWNYAAAMHGSATRWELLRGFFQALFGSHRPVNEVQTKLVRTRTRVHVTVEDTRIPGGPGLSVTQHFTLKRPSPVTQTRRPNPQPKRFSLANVRRIGASLWWQVVSVERVNAVRRNWNLLWGLPLNNLVPEPTLMDVSVPVTVQIPPVRLEDLTPASQAYWMRRRELEAEITNVTGFMKHWTAKLDSQNAKATELRRKVGDQANMVKNLPRPEEGQKSLKEIQQKMSVTEHATSRSAQAADLLESRLTALVAQTASENGELVQP